MSSSWNERCSRPGQLATLDLDKHIAVSVISISVYRKAGIAGSDLTIVHFNISAHPRCYSIEV